MGVQRYILHPGVGQNPPVAGAARAQKDGAEFSWLEQIFPVSQDTESHFQGIVAPPEKLGSGVITFKAVFRQSGIGVGNVRVDCFLAQVAVPSPRDVAPASLGPATVASAGVDSGEFTYSWTKDISLVAIGEELLFQIKRIGTDGLDDVGADITLVRVEVYIPSFDSFVFDSTWNGSHPVLGTFHLWVDETGPQHRLRIKDGVPGSEVDGQVVGEESAA